MGFCSRRIFGIMLWPTVAVVGVAWFLVLAEFVLFPGMRYISFFDLNSETNLPTWLSSSLLLVCAALTGFIAAHKKGDRFQWAWQVLALGFLVMSLDEIAQIHEKISFILHKFTDLGGILYHPWVIPGALLVMILGVFYLRFLLSLPSPSKKGFILGAAVYLSGVLGMELIGNAVTAARGEVNLQFASVAALEETLELAGILILIRVFIAYIVRELPGQALFQTEETDRG